MQATERLLEQRLASIRSAELFELTSLVESTRGIVAGLADSPMTADALDRFATSFAEVELPDRATLAEQRDEVAERVARDLVPALAAASARPVGPRDLVPETDVGVHLHHLVLQRIAEPDGELGPTLARDVDDPGGDSRWAAVHADLHPHYRTVATPTTIPGRTSASPPWPPTSSSWPRHHVERVWASADRHLYVAGLGLDHHGCDEAIRFLVDAREILTEHLPDSGISVGAAVAAGTVTTGVVGGEQLAFGMWGEPTRLALAMAAVSDPGQVLVHESVSRRLEVAGVLDGVRVRVDLGDGPIEVDQLRERASTT